MLDLDRAREIAQTYLRTRFAITLRDQVVLLEQETIEKKYGWSFFYQHKTWIQSGKTRDGLIGNAPFIVERESGRIVKFGSSAGSVDYWCQRYESNWIEIDADGIAHLTMQ
jgi:hypothetical protein